MTDTPMTQRQHYDTAMRLLDLSEDYGNNSTLGEAERDRAVQSAHVHALFATRDGSGDARVTALEVELERVQAVANQYQQVAHARWRTIGSLARLWMPDENVVERVARAIWQSVVDSAAEDQTDPGSLPPWEDRDDKDEWRSNARAALWAAFQGVPAPIQGGPSPDGVYSLAVTREQSHDLSTVLAKVLEGVALDAVLLEKARELFEVVQSQVTFQALETPSRGMLG